MGHAQSKVKKDFHEQRKVLVDDIIKVENELKELKKRKSELGDTDGHGEDINYEEDKIHEENYRKKLHTKGFKWPDPDPSGEENLVLELDDVSRMNATPVSRLFMVRNNEDVKHVLHLARTEGVPVSMRGTKHSMGGQTIAENGYVMDMDRINHMKYNKKSSSVTLGPGALWSNVVFYLNRFGMSPRTLQSYSTFSVGGSLSVNAHGITSDDSVQESVLSLTLIKWDGTEVVCSRGEDGEAGELFSLVLGGYGMFGVIVEVEMSVVPNVHLWSEMIDCSLEEFPIIYGNLLDAEDVNIKLGRIDTVSGERCQIFVFRTQNEEGVRTVSNLPLEPREMSRASQVMYKWILPGGKMIRSMLENAAHKALDWSEENERNQLIFESCEPLARLYSPFHELEDTFILQEFFIPKKEFLTWTSNAKSILTKKYENVTLLNCTVRFVNEDKTTALSYSRISEGSYAFVLYYRIRRCKEADKVLEEIHHCLAEISLKLGGTFYLPYRHHYSVQQIKQSYPKIIQFFEKKKIYDPHGLFRSKWSDHYMKEIFPEFEFPLFSLHDAKRQISHPEGDFKLPIVSQQRQDSYRRLMRNPVQRNEFLQNFFKNIFNIESGDKLKSFLAKAIADPRNITDTDVYQALAHELATTDGPLNQITKIWRSIMQIRRQRKELSNETATILHRLGISDLNGLVNIGDTGKLVKNLIDSGAVSGNVWVVHDDLGGLPAMLERESEEEVGEFVFIDYKNPTRLDIPDNAADLVTLNQGLHHFPQQSLIPFLQEVYRVLRPGGLFIVREHDASDELIPVLDLAHSIFNVVTGVSVTLEREEIRAFRPVVEWRKIMESVGLMDTYLYEMEKGDPTLDEMMCFVKGSLVKERHFYSMENLSRKTSTTIKCSKEKKLKDTKDFYKQSEHKVEALAKNLPNITLEIVKNFIGQLLDMMDKMKEKINNHDLGLSSGQALVVQQLANQFLDPALEMVKVTQTVVNEAKITDSNFDVVPDELVILINGLMKKAEDGTATAPEMILAGVFKDIKEMFNSDDCDSRSKPDEKIDITMDEVERLIQRLLVSQPTLQDLDNLQYSDFGHSAKLFIESNLGKKGTKLDSKSITESIYPYLDQYSWNKIEPALEEIIQDSQNNKFLFKNLTDPGSPWYQALMGILSSKEVKFSGFGKTLASAAGLGSLIDMWKVAQQLRKEEDDPNQEYQLALKNSLTSKSRTMLTNATQLMLEDVGSEDISVESLLRCLKLSGLISRKGQGGEFTWFKLVEWLQVEYIQIFGESLQEVPWYRFPFRDMMKKYFGILYQEMKIVYEKQGIVKAGFSWAFFTDFVPGIVMSFIFGQLGLLALPIRAVLGDEYSEESMASQYEEAILVSRDGWEDLENSDIHATKIVDGLYMMKIPSLGNFTDAILTIAQETQNNKLLTISSHTEIQMKVSVARENFEKLKLSLDQERGVKVMFDYKLPETGTEEDNIRHLCLCVQVVHLLDIIRKIQSDRNNSYKIEQIYDYWG